MSAVRVVVFLLMVSCGVSVLEGAPESVGASADGHLTGAGPIAGFIDGATWSNNQLIVSGWACDQGVASSIDVHVYVGGAAGVGTILGGFRAGVMREPAVSAACRTTGVAHGFRIGLARSLLAPHAGKALYVHGISLSGGANSLLNNSGRFRVPAPLPASEVLLSAKVRGATSATDLTIPAGESVIIDTSVNVGFIDVAGRLRCPDTGVFTLTTDGISVLGAGAVFECGAVDRRFGGKLTLQLKGGRTSPHGERGIDAMSGGAVRLFGQAKNFGWVHVAASVAAGGLQVVLDAPVDWTPGDRIVVGPTSFNAAEAEERVVTTVAPDRRSLTVSSPFSYAHTAFAQTYSNGVRSWVLDERAEVANLTRNIVVTAAGDAAALDLAQRGAHVMVMAGGSAQIDGVEFVRVGQLGALGRYPFHWHLVGDANGQFIKNSSIHNSYQRCVTIHGTNRALVENNVCFDHFGHGFFFEQGNEVDNLMVHNLGMKSKRVPSGKGLLHSDMTSEQRARFSAPATFWVANPRNVVRGNVASGSQGTGFWMAFSKELTCQADLRCQVSAGGGNVFPSRGDTLEFAGNVAHASEVGMTWDGAEDGDLMGNALNPAARKTVSTHYVHGAQTPVFPDLVVFKNAASGVYFRGGSAQFPRLIAADNGYSHFFAYDQTVTDGLVVGASQGLTAAELAWAQAISPDVRITSLQGIRIYDGPFELRNVHFADFGSRPGVRAWPFVNIGGANRSVNLASGLTWDSSSQQRIAMKGEFESFGSLGWAETAWTTAVRDVDGTLSGNRGRLLVPNHPLNLSFPECTALPAVVGDGFACSYDWGVLAFFESTLPPPYDANHFPFTVARVDEATGAVVTPQPIAVTELLNKTGLIAGSRYRYRLGAAVAPTVLRVRWQIVSGAVSPLLEVPGATSCRPLGAPLVSLGGLRATNSTGYALSGGSLFFKLAPGLTEFACQ